MRIVCPRCSHLIEVGPSDTPRDVTDQAPGSTVREVPRARHSCADHHRRLGKLTLLERVGAGSFGEVWKAHDTELNRLDLELILADGTIYPHKGTFAFADRQVDQSTGAIQLTGLFPNPGNILRPGQYGRVRAAIATIAEALLVPQQAVTELQGSHQVAIVDSKNTVSIATVKVGDRVGSMWVINEGLKPGQSVVAVGVQKVGAGMHVSPKPLAQNTEITGGK